MDTTADTNIDTNPNALESDFSGVALLLHNGRFKFRYLAEANLLAQFIAKACPNPRLAIMGISELLINAIEHGNLGIGSEEKAKLQQQNIWIEEINRRCDLPEYKTRIAEVQFTRTETEIELVVTDQGEGFDWKAVENGPSDRLSTHGRGILMAKQLVFKRLEYSGKGNIVTGIIARH